MRKQFLFNIVVAALTSVLIYPGSLAAAPYKRMSSSVGASQVLSKDTSAEKISTGSKNNQPTAVVAARTISSTKVYGSTVQTNNTPKESVPSEVSSLTGDTLTIPSLGISAPLTDVGLTSEGAVAVPAGMQVGHWNGSAKPGTRGLAFLDGHTPGVFSGLTGISAGHIFNVHYNGQDLLYKVVFTEIVPLASVNMSKALRVYGGAAEGINLMTCAGMYDASLGTYNQRLIVYSVRI